MWPDLGLKIVDLSKDEVLVNASIIDVFLEWVGVLMGRQVWSKTQFSSVSFYN